MANKKDLEYIYSTIDELFRLSIGNTGDFSCAMYNGDYSMSLEAAQDAKHKFIARELKLQPGMRVLDMGCGWGPLLSYYTKECGVDAIGITLSDAQAKACKKNGLHAVVRDLREITPAEFGQFDAISSVGAFEHFCSAEDMLTGRQPGVYRKFFQLVHDLLKPGGRAYIQTMVFGKNMIPYEQISLKAPKGSDAYILGLMIEQFPGSWLPYGAEMVEETAAPWFNLIFKSSGRLDYIETITQWDIRYRRFHWKKYLLFLSLLPRYLYSREFRYRVEIFQSSPNQECFRREIMDHYRMVFERK